MFKLLSFCLSYLRGDSQMSIRIYLFLLCFLIYSRSYSALKPVLPLHPVLQS